MKQSVVVVVLIANSTFISISPFLCKFQPIIKEGLVIFDISEANQFFTAVMASIHSRKALLLLREAIKLVKKY